MSAISRRWSRVTAQKPQALRKRCPSKAGFSSRKKEHRLIATLCRALRAQARDWLGGVSLVDAVEFVADLRSDALEVLLGKGHLDLLSCGSSISSTPDI